MNTYTDLFPSHILFASPSFLGGFGSVLDLGNTLFEYNQSLDGKQADYFATKADWIRDT